MLTHERIKRRVLYGVTVWAWGLTGHFIWASIHYESPDMRVGLLVTLGVASTLTTATLFAVFVAPLEAVYRHGYEAGQQSSGCSAFRPDIRTVIGARQSAVVIPIRPVRHLSSTDN